jgi:hypothetical protein
MLSSKHKTNLVYLCYYYTVGLIYLMPSTRDRDQGVSESLLGLFKARQELGEPKAHQRPLPATYGPLARDQFVETLHDAIDFLRRVVWGLLALVALLLVHILDMRR